MPAASKEDREELVRLLAVKIIWPSPLVRKEFPTELHLERAIERLYERIYLTCYVPKEET